MGRTKSYMDTETIENAAGFSNSARSKKRQDSTLGRATPKLETEASFQDLYRQISNRARRNWIAFQYRFHRSTFDVFRKKEVRQIGLMLFVAWFFFSGDRNLADLFSNPISFFLGKESLEKQIGSFQEVIGNGSVKPVSITENGAAPVSASDLRETEALEYIENFGKVAQVEMQKFGIPASISLAQGLVESRAGHSTLAKRNKNHFGMKCFSKKCRKGHCSNFTDDHHKDFFRIYNNAWESWRAHSEMLASGRYAALKKYGKDYRQWASGLKNLGYATDRNYAEKLVGMIEKYDLDKFDK